jgi:N-acetylglucosamine-6-sulfatase
LWVLVGLTAWQTVSPAAEARPNVIFILSDDHRFDFLSCMPQAPHFLETPHLDRLAREGAHFSNAFVTTSLCSPSRASILTGQFIHHHQVVDNQRAIPAGTVFFPEYLRQAGYTTAFVGKWHMGHDDDAPRPGFDHWASFKGQGEYFDPLLNINGTRQKFSGYTTDVLTDQATQWLAQHESTNADRPFFLYLSYKAVHYPFTPAPRNAGRYREARIDYPETMANTEQNYASQPRWVRERRYSIHGIDHMETGRFDQDPVPDFDALYRSYAETVFGLDENIGKLLQFLDQHALAENTVVIYMGDNGFHLGEHGFYDKRDAYETSIRVPLIVKAPGMTRANQKIAQMALNIDIAPTVLELAGASDRAAKARFDGTSLVPLLRNESISWRDHFLYEYHWEWNFPATPSLFAIRTERFKYVFHHGCWDRDALYDLQTDPLERHNLVSIPAYADQLAALRTQLFAELEASGALQLPVRVPAGERLDQRKLPR